MSPKPVQQAPVAQAKPAAAPVSPRQGGAVPAWKLAQMEREKAEQERIEAEKKKKQEASLQIAERQAKLGADADAGSDVPTYSMAQHESSSPRKKETESAYATNSIVDSVNCELFFQRTQINNFLANQFCFW